MKRKASKLPLWSPNLQIVPKKLRKSFSWKVSLKACENDLLEVLLEEATTRAVVVGRSLSSSWLQQKGRERTIELEHVVSPTSQHCSLTVSHSSILFFTDAEFIRHQISPMPLGWADGLLIEPRQRRSSRRMSSVGLNIGCRGVVTRQC
eukprot:Gb_24663 [translate_table: standard]